MSIAVLISIRPKWCEKIISGEKKIEVRKTRPKLIPQFKCYIYCTQSAYMLWILKEMERSLHPDKIADVFKAAKCGGAYRGNGKVIGEFLCDQIIEDRTYGHNEEFYRAACMSAYDAAAYAMQSPMYGWHISDLRVYDHPRDLWEFTGLRQTKYGLAPGPITRPPQSWRYVEEELWND